MNVRQGRKSARAILSTIQIFNAEENRQLVVSHMVRLLNENEQKELAFYITTEAYEQNMLIGYKYAELIKLLGKEDKAEHINFFAQEYNLLTFAKALDQIAENNRTK